MKADTHTPGYHFVCKLLEVEKAKLTLNRAQLKAATSKVDVIGHSDPSPVPLYKAIWLKHKLEVLVAKQRLHLLEYEASMMDALLPKP